MTTTPRAYRKRPVQIHAMRYDGTPESATPIINWIIDSNSECTATWSEPYEAYEGPEGSHRGFPGGIKIQTLEGDMIASAGDWVIRGILNEFYPCKPDVFTATYEEIVQ